jgi:hypothetical protein
MYRFYFGTRTDEVEETSKPPPVRTLPRDLRG